MNLKNGGGPATNVLQTANSTIDISGMLNNGYSSKVKSGASKTKHHSKPNEISHFLDHEDESSSRGLPKLTEVWRWIKNLLSSYIALKKDLYLT